MDNPTATASLPPDMITEILSRLPATVLLRFKSVCKRWNDEIGSRYFIKLHLSRSLQAGLDGTQLVFTKKLGGLYLLHLPSTRAIELHALPINLLPNEGKFRGYCNGLLCYSSKKLRLCENSPLVYDVVSFILSNPTTRTYTSLPSLTKLGDLSEHVTTWPSQFGYDCTSGDYKVLAFLQYRKREELTFRTVVEAHIYSCKNDSWKSIEHCPWGVRIMSCHTVVVQNAFHWIVQEKQNAPGYGTICAFNLGTEQYYKVPLPDQVYECCYKFLTSLNGYLHMAMPTYNMRREIWVMKEYGVKESWTKLFCYSTAQLLELHPQSWPCYMLPCAYLEGGSKILVKASSKHHFICCDLRNQTIEKVEFAGSPYEMEDYMAEPWIASLLSPTLLKQ